MLFNSLAFLVFFAVFFLLWPVARRNANYRWSYIVFFSLFFYGWWDWRYIALLLATGMVDFVAGLAIFNLRHYARPILWVSLGSNLAVLGFFKYELFVSESLSGIGDLLGINWHIPVVSLALPIGISFYTFQSMSYTIDIYRRELQPTRNVLQFFAAITMFPHLVAGPIMRASKLLPQLLHNRIPSRDERWEGLRLIVHGFFKKMVIADNLAATINDAFSGQLAYDFGLAWWIIVAMFAMQIYCDFSGYSDIARGLAKWMGYDFTLNFYHPYTATSLRDFWKRWHISLSTWFRDYVYIPLGGSRNGALASYGNVFITMTVSGLWHGAGWTYVLWGALHGLFLILERITKWPELTRSLSFGTYIAWSIVMVQVLVAWVFFRAGSLSQAMDILQALFSFGRFDIPLSRTAMLFFAVGIIYEWYVWIFVTNRCGLGKASLSEATVFTFIIIACVFLRGPGNTFIYFQF